MDDIDRSNIPVAVVVGVGVVVVVAVVVNGNDGLVDPGTKKADVFVPIVVGLLKRLNPKSTPVAVMVMVQYCTVEQESRFVWWLLYCTRLNILLCTVQSRRVGYREEGICCDNRTDAK